jgi:hypothetical protein
VAGTFGAVAFSPELTHGKFSLPNAAVKIPPA